MDMGKDLEAWKTSKDIRIKVEAQTDSTSFQFRTPGTTRRKMDAQVAYGVGFGSTIYGWKDNLKKLPMALVSGPNSTVIDGNRPSNMTSRICLGAATPYLGLWAVYLC